MIRIRGFELVVAILLSLAAHGGFLILAGVDQQSVSAEIPDRVVYLDLAAFDEDLDSLEPMGATVADPLAAPVNVADLETDPIVAPVKQTPEQSLAEVPSLEPMAISALVSHTQDRTLTPPEEPPPPVPNAPAQQPGELVPTAPNNAKSVETEIIDTVRPDAPTEVAEQTPSPAKPLPVAAPPPTENAKNPTEEIPDQLSEPGATLAPEIFSEPELPRPTQPMAESVPTPVPLLDVAVQPRTLVEQPSMARPQQTEITPPDQSVEPDLLAPEAQPEVTKPQTSASQQTQVAQAAIEPPPTAPPISTTDPIQPVAPVAVSVVPPTLAAPPTDRPLPPPTARPISTTDPIQPVTPVAVSVVPSTLADPPADRPPPPPRLSEVEATEPPIARELTAPARAPQAAAAPVTVAAATPPAAVPRGPGVHAIRKARLSYGEALSLRINRLTRSSYPRWAIRKSVEGWIPVRIRIGPTGEILDLEVLDDTHAPSRLVETAVKMIRSAAPFEAFSDQMGTENAVFEVRVKFVLQ